MNWALKSSFLTGRYKRRGTEGGEKMRNDMQEGLHLWKVCIYVSVDW